MAQGEAVAAEIEGVNTGSHLGGRTTSLVALDEERGPQNFFLC